MPDKAHAIKNLTYELHLFHVMECTNYPSKEGYFFFKEGYFKVVN